jgi:hypothetical protein
VRAALLIFAMIVCAPAIARAQIVNVQGALAKVPDKDGLTGSLEGKVDWREGNNPVIDTSGSASGLLKEGRSITLAIVRAGYAESRDLVITKKTFEHLRERVILDEHFRWEVFGQHEFDQFRRLTVRVLLGTGPAVAIVNTDPFGLLAGLAYMFDYEQLDTRAGTIDAGKRSVQHRGSAYLTGSEKLGKNAGLVETVYVQPRFDDAAALRVLGELTLINKLTSRIALTNGFTMAYDARPPDGVKRFDSELKVGAILTF